MVKKNECSIIPSIYLNMVRNELEDKWMIRMGMTALSQCNFEEVDIEYLSSIKQLFVNRGLFLELIKSICNSFNTSLVARAALLWNSDLMEKFYGDKLGLYIYLTHVLSFPKEEADLLRKYLFDHYSDYLYFEAVDRVNGDIDNSQFVKNAMNIDKHIFHEACLGIRKIKRM